jgi:hypothetical protein
MALYVALERVRFGNIVFIFLEINIRTHEPPWTSTYTPHHQFSKTKRMNSQVGLLCLFDNSLVLVDDSDMEFLTRNEAHYTRKQLQAYFGADFEFRNKDVDDFRAVNRAQRILLPRSLTRNKNPKN